MKNVGFPEVRVYESNNYEINLKRVAIHLHYHMVITLGIMTPKGVCLVRLFGISAEAPLPV